MPVRILIADDHSMLRQGLRIFLELDPELQVVGEAADGAEAVRLARQLEPDVVLMDLLMPVMDGLAATAAIRRALPNTQVVALTGMLEDTHVVDAVRAGVSGSAPKSSGVRRSALKLVPESMYCGWYGSCATANRSRRRFFPGSCNCDVEDFRTERMAGKENEADRRRGSKGGIRLCTFTDQKV